MYWAGGQIFNGTYSVRELIKNEILPTNGVAEIS